MQQAGGISSKDYGCRLWLLRAARVIIDFMSKWSHITQAYISFFMPTFTHEILLSLFYLYEETDQQKTYHYPY